MKKIILFTLSLLSVISLTACGKDREYPYPDAKELLETPIGRVENGECIEYAKIKLPSNYTSWGYIELLEPIKNDDPDSEEEYTTNTTLDFTYLDENLNNENLKNGILYNVEVHKDFNDKQYLVSFYVNNIKESMEHNKETYEDVIEDAKRMRHGVSDNYIDVYDFNKDGWDILSQYYTDYRDEECVDMDMYSEKYSVFISCSVEFKQNPEKIFNKDFVLKEYVDSIMNTVELHQ